MNMLNHIEDAARVAMVNTDQHDPLPPGPNYGPFGYFRLALLILAGMVAVLFLFNIM
ncbi:hypothetical protein [Chelativorans sp.]|uniref:hypothetical protein n=1 Tax=Chelativorans sp. TaxID=2203393 RepID=UPI0028126EA1|nr:hypothetical protein [Chelativorans sp.]